MPTYKARTGVFCDLCKMEVVSIKDHPKSRRQAYITTVSETHIGSEPIYRSYCYSHLQEVSTWVDGSVWTLEEQIQYAKDHRKQLTLGF